VPIKVIIRCKIIQDLVLLGNNNKTNVDNIEVLERGNEQGFKSKTKMMLKSKLMKQEYTWQGGDFEIMA
jgi:hypothetical protein